MRKQVFAAVLACAALAVAAAPAAAETSLASPPKGANNWSCKPSAAHPDPVVLVHGLGATMGENWAYLSPLLAKRGYCVFALTYGMDPRFPYFVGGVIPIEQSAPELNSFVDRVLTATGASKVDLVGHSEGTFMPEYWLKYLGGATKVAKYVALAPLYKGTTLYGLASLANNGEKYGLSQPILNLISNFCGSCDEFLAGSPMVQKLQANGGPEVPGIQYTTIMSKYDEAVIPYTSGMLPPPADNIVIQDVCKTDLDEHGLQAFDPAVAQMIFNALDPATAQPVKCGALPPFGPPPS
ncbi:MAG TPA: alpha/beta fold hydrolase [Solirubrobacteraceae bacterium]|jgi:triacylglycerol esterase/lipase EstA (alpha/beta hydrolase family)|nr:alpha/beta fold hydrolase [Solirubrobacteraceae bacterium]